MDLDHATQSVNSEISQALRATFRQATALKIPRDERLQAFQAIPKLIFIYGDFLSAKRAMKAGRR